METLLLSESGQGNQGDNSYMSEVAIIMPHITPLYHYMYTYTVHSHVQHMLYIHVVWIRARAKNR